MGNFNVISGKTIQVQGRVNGRVVPEISRAFLPNIDIPLRQMSLALGFDSFAAAANVFVQRGEQAIELRAAEEIYIPETCESGCRAVRLLIRAMPCGMSCGELIPDKSTGASIEYQVRSFEAIVDGVELVNIDLDAGVFAVNSQDFSDYIDRTNT